MSLLLLKRIAAIFAACVVVVILGIAWLHVRDNFRLRHCSDNASEAFVIFNRSQLACYRMESDGAKELARLILEKTASHPLPEYPALILVEVVFVDSDGTPTLACSLPGRGVMSAEETTDYWEKIIKNIESAVRVPSEEMADRLGEKKSPYFLRRRSK